jgi:hypothetical protein
MRLVDHLNHPYRLRLNKKITPRRRRRICRRSLLVRIGETLSSPVTLSELQRVTFDIYEDFQVPSRAVKMSTTPTGRTAIRLWVGRSATAR